MSTFLYINSGVIPSSYLLDSYPAYAAYSVRKLKTGATNCIRARRASDNTEQDIGFSGDNMDTTALASFCSGTTGYVVTWYDQSGNGYDITQATTSLQPRIYASGVVDSVSGTTALKFSTTNILERTALSALSAGNNYSIFAVTSGATTNTVYGTIVTQSGTAGTRYVMFTDLRTTPDRNFAIQNTGGTLYTADLSTPRTTINQNRLLTNIVTSSLGMSAFDNGSTGGTATYTGTYTNNTFKVGAQHANQNPLNGHLQEIIVYSSNESSNRTAIESNIMTYYSI